MSLDHPQYSWKMESMLLDRETFTVGQSMGVIA